MLSFWNLIEAHVLRALRTEHAVSVKALRKALDYAEKELGIERLRCIAISGQPRRGGSFSSDTAN
jgi:hypothetical protein